MHSEITLVSLIISVLAIELDKLTQFTHPTLHAVAAAGILVTVYSMAFAA